MPALRDVYAQKAIAQIPRLLSLQDRNPFSPTYGCFHRDYWLYKTSDFPDAVRQFGVQALALVYTHDFPDNIYKGQAKVRDWAVAGLDFWARIQHKDGSFDEFYPYERGWVGPSAFTTYTAVEAYRLLQDEMPSDVGERVLTAIQRAARYIASGESEEDHLANHHAMACLAVWRAYELLGEPGLKAGCEHLWQGFLGYHNAEEGWSREYDGVDPGYLSATVSFLAKIYQSNPAPGIFEVLRQSVEFCSYFVYPNGFYAGSLGSRNTLHFYPHGFEILAGQMPLAAAVAERMLQALAEGKLVPPEIMSDRYVFYRVPEFLQAYLSYSPRPATLPPLPYEQDVFIRYFPQARFFVANRPQHYIVANLAKGGVVKVFDRQSGRLILNDCGIIGRLTDGRVVTSQWIDFAHKSHADEQGWEVGGYLQEVPSHKLFTPLKNLLFRGCLVALGWSPWFSHLLKGYIRKALMLGSRPIPARFQRRFSLHEAMLSITDTLQAEGNIQFAELAIGDEFFVRYVPQSRYFQTQELCIKGHALSASHIREINEGKSVDILRTIPLPTQKAEESDVRLVISTSDNKEEKELDAEQRQTVYWEKQTERRHPSDPIIAAFAQPKVKFFLQHVKLPQAAAILDVGCGNGYFTYYLQRLGSTVGVDLSKTMLSLNPCTSMVQATIYHLPFADATFDMVFCSNLLHHLSDPTVAIVEMKRVSRRYVVLSEPNRNNPAMLALGLVKREERWSLRFTARFLRSLAEKAGLEVLAYETSGFVTPNRMPRFITTLATKFTSPNPLAAYSIVVAAK